MSARSRHNDPTPAQFPALYAPWLDAVVGGPVPAERAATCGSCAMLPADATPASDDGLWFHPATKCCTYVPALPNYLVGGILLDGSAAMAAGRASVLARMADRACVTPLGLQAPPAFSLLYERSSAETFGRAPDLRCPHYLAGSGGCGIWPHRMSVCATWFCKHDRGRVGQDFWWAVRSLFEAVERALALHCVRTLAPSADATRLAVERRRQPAPSITPAHLGGAADDDAGARVWGRYAGRERGFFEDCARLVAELTWADVERIGGVEVTAAGDVVRGAYAALMTAPRPVAPRLGVFTIATAQAGTVSCTGYSGFDPVEVPTPLVDVLHVFDGRPVSRALAAARRRGVDADVAVVQRLIDFGLLEETDAGRTGGPRRGRHDHTR